MVLKKPMSYRLTIQKLNGKNIIKDKASTVVYSLV